MVIRRVLFLILFLIILPRAAFSQGPARYLYGVSTNNDLLRLTVPGFTQSVIGAINLADVTGLAHDQVTGTTYCVTLTGQICSINLQTAAAQVLDTITGLSSPQIYGIAFERVSGIPTLYITNSASPFEFFAVTLTNGPPFGISQLGTTGLNITGLSVHPTTTDLYAANRGNSTLVILNKSTGAVQSTIGNTGQSNIRGLAFDTENIILYGSRDTGNIIQYNIATGSGTTLTTTSLTRHMTYLNPSIPTATPTSVPTMTFTPTVTATPGIVSPSTKPVIVDINLITSGRKPKIILHLQEFSGASRRAAAAISYRYSIEIKRNKDAAGNKLKKGQRDIINLTSKRNELAVKNLKANSTYSVKYRVQITSKRPGQSARVVDKTPFSDLREFTFQ